MGKNIVVEDEISYCSIELIRKFPFYGHILIQLPKIFLPAENHYNIPTLGVGKEDINSILVKLYVNNGYILECFEYHEEKLAIEHVIEVLKHEILHIVFGHLSVKMPDKARWSTAVDLAVNSYCCRGNMLTIIDPKTKKPYIDPVTKKKVSQGLFAEDYNLETKKSALWYYNQLLNNEQFKNQCKSGLFGIDGLLSNAINSHGLWETAQQDPMIEEMVKDLVRKSVNICKETKKWGNIDGDLISQLEGLIEHNKPVVPWQHVLSLFIASAMESILDYTMKRRSRRFFTRPGTRKSDVLNLAIGIDSSGSISDEQLQLFFNELYWIHKNGAFIYIFECDTKIQKEYPYEKFDKKVTGRGGTNLEPVLKIATDRKFDALIYFTDFDAPKVSKRYNIPVLWVISDGSRDQSTYPYQWGRYIHIVNGEIVAA